MPAEFVERTTGPIKQADRQSSYGYFWWTQDYSIAGRMYHCKQGRGASTVAAPRASIGTRLSTLCIQT